MESPSPFDHRDLSDNQPEATQQAVHAPWFLFAGHIVVGFLLALAGDDDANLLTMSALALVLCQTSLLGIWGGLGPQPWLARGIGVCIGVAYLAFNMSLFIRGPQGLSILLLVFATTPIWLGTLAMRQLGIGLRRVEHLGEKPREALRFSLRDMLLLTGAIAVLLSLGKLLAPHIQGIEQVELILVLAICFVAIGVTSLWASLGFGLLARRAAAVFLIAAIAGLTAAHARGASRYTWFWLGMMPLDAALLMGSLLVVRRCGFRLAAGEDAAQPAEAASPETE